jgi:hypothetical protein
MQLILHGWQQQLQLVDVILDQLPIMVDLLQQHVVVVKL